MPLLRDLICKKYVPQSDHCTSIGTHISTAFINKSAYDIFDKDRALVELPLNSVDSYRFLRGKKSVGKFGMGFYSIFSFINKVPINSITIDSFFSKDDNWSIKFHTDEANEIIYEYIDRSIRQEQGTTIKIVDLDYKYNDNDMMKEITNNSRAKTTDTLYSVVQYLLFIPDVKIYLKYKDGETFFINEKYYDFNNENDDIIHIRAYYDQLADLNLNDEKVPNTIEIIDYASGISIDVLYNSLLIPGISTKKIDYNQVSLDISQNNITGINEFKKKLCEEFIFSDEDEDEESPVENYFYSCINNDTELFILVGDIPIIMETLLYGYTNKEVIIPYGYHIIIQMPVSTPLPVTRDNIIFTDEVKVIFYQLCDKIFHDILEKIFLEIFPVDVIIKFFNILYSMTDISLWQDEKLKELKKQNILFIPEETPDIVINLVKQINNKNIHLLKVNDSIIQPDHIITLENLLLENIETRKDLFVNKSVILSDDVDDLYQGYFNILLVLNPKYIGQLQNMIITYPEYKLEIVGSVDIDNFIKITKGLEVTFELTNRIIEYKDISLKERRELIFENIRIMMHQLYLLDNELFLIAITQYTIYYNNIINHVHQITGYEANRYLFYFDDKTYIIYPQVFENNVLKDKLIIFLKIIIIKLFKLTGTNNYVIPNICGYSTIPHDEVTMLILEISPDLYTYLALLKFYYRNILQKINEINVDKLYLLINYWKYRLENEWTRTELMLSLISNKEDITLNLYSIYTNYEDIADIPLYTHNEIKNTLIKEYLLSDAINYTFQKGFKKEHLYNRKAQIPTYNKEEKNQLIYIAANKDIKFRDGILQIISIINDSTNDLNKIKNLIIEHDSNNLVIQLSTITNINDNVMDFTVPFYYKNVNIFGIYPLLDFIIYYFKNFYFYDQIIRNNGQIIDVKRTVYMTDNKQNNNMFGIKASFIIDSESLLTLYLQEALYILLKIEPTNHSYTNYNKKIYNTQMIPVEDTLTDFKIYRVNPNLDTWYKERDSLISPISDLYKEYNSVNEIAKLTFKGYLIVMIPNHTTEKLGSYNATDIIYIMACDKYINPDTSPNILNSLIENSTTTTTDQIDLQQDDEITFFMGIYGWIYNILGRYKMEGFTTINKLIHARKHGYQITNANILPIQIACVDKWFSNKRKSITNENIVKSIIINTYHPEFMEWLRIFINNFYQMARNLQIPELVFKYETSPSLVLVDQIKNDSIAGKYDHFNHKITISQSQLIKIEDIIGRMNFKNEIVNESNNLYGNIFPVATLIHELFHSFEGMEHNNLNAHSRRWFTIKGKTKEYTWNDAAKKIYNLVLSNGLYDSLP